MPKQQQEQHWHRIANKNLAIGQSPAPLGIIQLDFHTPGAEQRGTLLFPFSFSLSLQLDSQKNKENIFAHLAKNQFSVWLPNAVPGEIGKTRNSKQESPLEQHLSRISLRSPVFLRFLLSVNYWHNKCGAELLSCCFNTHTHKHTAHTTPEYSDDSTREMDETKKHPRNTGGLLFKSGKLTLYSSRQVEFQQ